MHCSHHAAKTILVLLLTLLLTANVFAADLSVTADGVYCFSEGDFAPADAALSGVYVVSVPADTDGAVCWGSRVLRAGDVISADALALLRLCPAEGAEGACALGYQPITDEGLGALQTLRFSILGEKNAAPTCLDGTFETYKNISHSGTLLSDDPEGDALSYQLVKAPRRGEVTLHDDGSFDYTPDHNKVGKDSFVFTATDAAGNVSNEACIKVKIVKPTDQAMYADMADRDGEYVAMWLKERGAYTGTQIAGHLCFAPDDAVDRGEFLVMAMHLLGLPPEDAALTSGFADETETPQWMRPYLVSALRGGVVSGTSTDDGLLFRPAAALTRAEATVMLRNMLSLPKADTAPAMALEDDSASDIPVWAQEAVAALAEAGIETDTSACLEPISRMEAAQMLYDACMLSEREAIPTLNLAA